jgi:iron complex outermembrane recepter protein
MESGSPQRIFPSPNHPDSAALFDCPPDPNDPTAEPTTCFTVHKGDRIPGIPQHIFKAGFDYWLTPQWKFGADLLAASNQIFFGDEANLSSPLAGYARINLHSSYDITDNVQVYGLIQNLTDNDYAVYGTIIVLKMPKAQQRSLAGILGTTRVLLRLPFHSQPMVASR